MFNLKYKNEKGSITLYVLVAMLLMISVLTIVYMQINQKNTNQLKELSSIQKEYQINNKNMDDNYEEIIDKNNIYISLYTADGKLYDINQWTNQSLSLKIYYPQESLNEDKYYYKDGEKIKYTENEIIENNCTVKVEYEGEIKEVQIAKIDKILPTVTLEPDGGDKTISVGNTTANISVKVEATDNESGIKKVEYQISTSGTIPSENDSNWKEIENGSTINENKEGGKYYIYTKVTDNAGNVSIEKSQLYNISYEVRYNANGGSGAPSTQTKENGTTLVLSSTKPTRTGYTFVGWAITSNATTAQYQPGESYVEDKSVTLYAVWIDTTLPTVTLSSNGGTGTITEGQTKATISTKIEAVDNESGLNELKYAWSQSNTEEPSNWTTFTNGQIVSKTDCSAGTYYLWTKVTDMAGNRAETIKVSKAFNVTSSISGGTTKYVKKGGSITLTPTKGGQAGKITWTTSSSSGAQLSSTSGNSVTVKGLTAGTYTVKATESVGGKSTSYTIQVTELTSGGNATVLEGNTVTLKAPTKSSNAGTVTYKVTSGTSYATVNSTTGVVTGKEALAEKTTATITATESNGGATCTYTVTIKVWDGSGTLSDPYKISNLRDIKKLSEKTNKASTSSANYTYSSKYFKQTANINLGGSSAGNWTPIGKDATRFNGTYDGGSKTISGLYINYPSGNVGDRGLFGNTNTKATIKNLTISNASVTTISVSSSMCVGYNRGRIENVKVVGGTLKAGAYSGSIAGNNDGGTIISCTNSATVSYTSTISSDWSTIRGWRMRWNCW